MEDDLLNGDGSNADFLNLFGDNFEANQTAFDVADNGQISSSGTGTTVSSPNWLSNLANTLLSNGSSLVSAFTNKPTQTNATTTSSSFGSILPWLIGALVVIGGVLFVVRRN